MSGDKQKQLQFQSTPATNVDIPVPMSAPAMVSNAINLVRRSDAL
jgi:hypothetical protein